eukprot:13323641-Heterocapsa_arctica.AAC.1
MWVKGPLLEAPFPLTNFHPSSLPSLALGVCGTPRAGALVLPVGWSSPFVRGLSPLCRPVLHAAPFLPFP